MDALGVYLYCFTRRGAVREIKAAGVDERSAVTTLEADEAAAVFSTVSLREFAGDAAQAGAQDPEWLIPRACRHERVVEEVMRTAPVLPVRFGTLFSSGKILERFLAEKSGEVARVLDRLSDKEEWAVKGFVDLGRAKEWLMACDPVLAEHRRRLPDAPGARYFQQKRLDAKTEEAMRLWRRGVIDQVRALLAPHAVDACPLRPQPKNLTGCDAEMIFNAAYLLLRSDIDTFREQVARVGAMHAEQGLTLEVSGPWPPYNFCPPLREDQDEARGVLHSA
jgi:hypothetical protein